MQLHVPLCVMLLLSPRSDCHRRSAHEADSSCEPVPLKLVRCHNSRVWFMRSYFIFLSCWSFHAGRRTICRVCNPWKRFQSVNRGVSSAVAGVRASPHVKHICCAAALLMAFRSSSEHCDNGTMEDPRFDNPSSQRCYNWSPIQLLTVENWISSPNIVR